MLFSCDHGNAQIKTLKHVFASGITRDSIRPDSETEYVKYNGAFYTLTGENAPYKFDKTVDDTFLILNMFAMAKTLRQQRKQKYNETFEMGCCLPIEQYGIQKESFADYFQRRYEFDYCDVPHIINVPEVYVVPQAYAAAKAYQKELHLKDFSTAIIIDGGGYTWDVCVLHHGKLDNSYLRSFDSGLLRFKSNAIAYIRKSYGQDIKGTHVDAIIAGEKTVLSEAIKKDVKAVAAEHTRTILDVIRQDGWDIRSSPTFFFGGAPLYFKNYLGGLSKEAVTFINNVKANVIGIQILSQAHYAKRNGK